MSIDKKRTIQAILFTAGLLLVLVSLFADAMGIGQGSKDHFGLFQWLLLITGSVMIIVSVASHKLSVIVTVNGAIFVTLLIVLDNFLYLSSPWLPLELVRKMSVDAQTKYELQHWGELDFGNQLQEGDNFFFKPYYTQERKDYTAYYDEFGYRNPPGYITQIDPDVILLGDSFTEGSTKTTIAEFLRSMLSKEVYSMGIGGQGPPHWKMHFRRYMDSEYVKTAPRAVVLNFYSGNDISDILSYIPGKVDIGHFIAGKPEPPKRKVSYFNELIAIARYAMNKYYGSLPRSFVQMETNIGEIPDPRIIQAFSEIVQEIRSATSPSTVILLSYITTPAAIYGPDVNHCMQVTRKIDPNTDYTGICEHDARFQVRNSEFLSKIAQSLDIEYLDPTVALRKAAQKGTILHHIMDPHFNDEGNRIYSQEISEKLKTLMPGALSVSAVEGI